MTFRDLRFLIIDDYADTRELFAYLFEDLGARVMAVGTMEEAIDRWPTIRPDIILCEPLLKEENGYQLLGRIQELPGGDEVIAIAISVAARNIDRDRALAAGFNAHLAKPVDVLALEALVARLILDRQQPSFEQ